MAVYCCLKAGLAVCSHTACEEALKQDLENIPPSSEPNVRQILSLLAGAPQISLKDSYTGSLPQDLAFIIGRVSHEGSVAYSESLGDFLYVLLQNCSCDLQRHFISACQKVFELFLGSGSAVSFDFTEVQIHYECAKGCLSFPCCSGIKCAHADMHRMLTESPVPVGEATCKVLPLLYCVTRLILAERRLEKSLVFLRESVFFQFPCVDAVLKCWLQLEPGSSDLRNYILKFLHDSLKSASSQSLEPLLSIHGLANALRPSANKVIELVTWAVTSRHSSAPSLICLATSVLSHTSERVVCSTDLPFKSLMQLPSGPEFCISVFKSTAIEWGKVIKSLQEVTAANKNPPKKQRIADGSPAVRLIRPTSTDILCQHDAAILNQLVLLLEEFYNTNEATLDAFFMQLGGMNGAPSSEMMSVTSAACDWTTTNFSHTIKKSEFFEKLASKNAFEYQKANAVALLRLATKPHSQLWLQRYLLQQWEVLTSGEIQGSKVQIKLAVRSLVRIWTAVKVVKSVLRPVTIEVGLIREAYCANCGAKLESSECSQCWTLQPGQRMVPSHLYPSETVLPCFFPERKNKTWETISLPHFQDLLQSFLLSFQASSPTTPCHSLLTNLPFQTSFYVLKESIKAISDTHLPELLKTAIRGSVRLACFDRMVAKHMCARMTMCVEAWSPEMSVECYYAAMKNFSVEKAFKTARELLMFVEKIATGKWTPPLMRFTLKSLDRIRKQLHTTNAKLLLSLPPSLLHHFLSPEDSPFLSLLSRDSQDDNVHICNCVLAKSLADPEVSESAVLSLYYRLTRLNGRHAIHVEHLVAEIAWLRTDFQMLENVFRKLQYPKANLLDYIKQKGDIIRMRSVVQLIYRYGLQEETRSIWQLSELSKLPPPSDWLTHVFDDIDINAAKASLVRLHSFFSHQCFDIWDETIKVAFGFEDALRDDSPVKSANKLVALARLLLSLPPSAFSTLKLTSLAIHLQFISMDLALLCTERICSVGDWSDTALHLDALLGLALEGRNNPLAITLIDTILRRCRKSDIELVSISGLLSSYLAQKSITLSKELRSKLPFWQEVSKAVTHDVLQVQRAAIGLITECAESTKLEDRLELLRALASVGQRNSSLEALKEHLYDIQARIAAAYGALGALPPARLPLKLQPQGAKDDTVSSLIAGYMNTYMQVESTFLSNLTLRVICNALTETEANKQGYVLLKSLLPGKEAGPPNPAFGQEGLLRNWCGWLIKNHAPPDFQALSPVIEVSLDCTAKALQLLLNQGLIRQGQFFTDTVEFIHDLLRYSGVSTKNIALRVLEKVNSADGTCILTKIQPHLLVTSYCELLEFPKALYWLEIQIRTKFSNMQRRLNPTDIEKEDFQALQLVYHQMKEHYYIREVPLELDLLPHGASDEALFLFEKIAAEALDKGAYERIDVAGGLYTLEEMEKMRRPQLRKKVLEHLSGSMWRQQDYEAVKLLLGKWERDMTGLEALIARTCLCFHQTKSVEDAVRRGKELSFYMCNVNAEYPQAYDYVFFHHILHDALLLHNREVAKVLERHKLLRPEFRYLEIALRFALVLSNNLEDRRILAAALVKTALRHRKRDYANLLVSHICWSSDMLSDLRLIYYQMKLSLSDSNSLFLLRQRVERFMEAIPDGDVKLKYQARVLLVKAVCRLNWDLQLNTVKQLKETYFSPSEAEQVSMGVYVERGLYTLAAHLDRFLLNGKAGGVDLKAYACSLYFTSLRYAQRKALRSLPRALSLFFSLNKGESHDCLELLNLNKSTKSLANELPTFIFCDVLEQLLSHSNHESGVCKVFIFDVTCRLMKAHTPQLCWYILPMLFSSTDHSLFAKKVLAALRVEISSEAYSKVESSANVLKSIIDFSKDLTTRKVPASLLSELRCCLPLPIKPNFAITSQGFPPNPILLTRFDPSFEVIESKARPKKVKLVGSDGLTRLFLCKFESSGDMRKEARIAVFIQLVNKLLRKNPKASELDLQLPSFCLLAISPACALIEWVPSTSTLRSIIMKQWRLKGYNFDITQLDKSLKNSSAKAWDYVQTRIQPQLHRHFLVTCPDGNRWHENRLRFTRSLAAWSIFGYIIGLGDRHCDNILMTETGELIFIDFDCVFDMGRTLKVPEMVPFRLTPELQDGLGIYGESGEFLYACEVMLDALKEMSTELSSAFEPFIHDPLIVPIRNPEFSRTDNDINNTLSIVVSRLKGQKSVSEPTLYPTTRLQVLDLVAKAKDVETLRKMFIGWMAWM